MNYAPQMSYAPQSMSYSPPAVSYAQPSYGAYGAQPAYGGFVQESVVEQQRLDATKALEGQAQVHASMLDQQYEQAKAQLYQTWKQQEMQLDMAKQQRTMAIQQQAASMQAQATQYKLQMEMQQKMSTLYCGSGAT